MGKSTFRDKIDSGKFFAVPGIHDMVAAVVAEKIGFDLVYGSGYWLTASAYGLPDAGIATYTQMLDRMTTLKKTISAGLIADADTGYGGLLNVHHTVRGYEDAGISGIQIEDQEFPKKCGHTANKKCIPTEDMVEKIKVACEARCDPVNTLIIARTDARQAEGFDQALRRGEAYSKAGADVVFLEALLSEEEMAKACRTIDKPMMANMADGGKTPILSRSVLEEIGYAYAIFPSITGLAAAAAVETALRSLKATGSTDEMPVRLFDFKEFCGLIGFDDVYAFEKRWAKETVDAT